MPKLIDRNKITKSKKKRKILKHIKAARERHTPEKEKGKRKKILNRFDKDVILAYMKWKD